MADDDLAQRLLDGDRRALARAITLVESDRPEGWDVVRRVFPRTGSASMVGLTGPPGAGKSTIIAALVKARRAQDRTVAVLSIDPSSPFTQGAVLGDRIRLTEHFLDPASSSGRWPTGAPRRPGRGDAAGRAAHGRVGQGRRLPRDGRRRPGRGRHHRPRRHRRARAHPGSGDSSRRSRRA
jgi:energy-coupling factor transporter ATP-binding protein EcfA2